MSRLTLRLLILLVVLASLLVVLFRLPLSQFTIRHGFRALNIEVQRTSTKVFDWNAIEFDEFAASLPVNGGNLHFEATDLKLHFHPLRVFQGKLDALRAESLSFSFTPQPSKALSSESDLIHSTFKGLDFILSYSGVSKLVGEYASSISIENLTLQSPRNEIRSEGYIMLPGESKMTTRFDHPKLSHLELSIAFSTSDRISLDLVDLNGFELAHIQLFPAQNHWRSDFFLNLTQSAPLVKHVLGIEKLFFESIGSGSSMGGHFEFKRDQNAIRISGDGNARFSKLNSSFAQLDSFGVQSNWELTLSPSKLAINIPSARGKFEKLVIGSLRANDSSVQLSYSGEIPLVPVSSVEALCSPCNLSVGTQSFRADTFETSLRRAQDSNSTLQGPVSVQSFSWSTDDRTSTPLNGAGSVSIRDQLLRLEIQPESESFDFTADASLVQSLTSSSGQVHFEIPEIAFNSKEQAFSKILQPWPFPVDFVGGKLSLRGTLPWGEENPEIHDKEPRLEARLDSVSGQVLTFPFEGLNASPSSSGSTVLSALDPFTLSIETFQAGVLFSEIEAQVKRVDLRGELLLHLEDVEAQSLGGNIRSKTVELDFARKDNPFLVTLSNLDVAKITELEQSYNLNATGTISGSLPFHFGKAGVEIRGGQIAAHSPGGIIQLKSKDGSGPIQSGNTGLQLVFESLENYEYTSLVSDVNYANDGTLQLGVKLKGRNPERNKGRPVHFNVNVEENIPSLLKSLSLKQYLEENLEKKLRKGLAKKTG